MEDDTAGQQGQQEHPFLMSWVIALQFQVVGEELDFDHCVEMMALVDEEEHVDWGKNLEVEEDMVVENIVAGIADRAVPVGTVEGLLDKVVPIGMPFQVVVEAEAVRVHAVLLKLVVAGLEEEYSWVHSEVFGQLLEMKVSG
jgi:hypothetical protein